MIWVIWLVNWRDLLLLFHRQCTEGVYNVDALASQVIGHLHVDARHTSELTMLLLDNNSINEKDRNHQTLLHLLVKANKNDFVEILRRTFNASELPTVASHSLKGLGHALYSMEGRPKQCMGDRGSRLCISIHYCCRNKSYCDTKLTCSRIWNPMQIM